MVEEYVIYFFREIIIPPALFVLSTASVPTNLISPTVP